MAEPKSPLDASSSARLLDTFRAGELIRLWKEDFNIDISGELAGIQEISLYRCEASGLDFFLPLSAVGSDQLYQHLQKFDWFYMRNKWEFRQAIRDLGGCERILEVGSGPGHFVERADNQLKGKIKGIEFNEAAVQQATRKNLPVERIDLHELTAKGETFDALCSFQLLEHVAYPFEILKALISILTPRGKLILSVPNKDSFLRYQYNLLDMPPHHMTRWSAFTFRYLEKLLPLKLLQIRFEPLAPYHVQGYIAAYGQYWRTKLPLVGRLLPDQRLGKIAEVLKKSRLCSLLRGQSLYAVFMKL